MANELKPCPFCGGEAKLFTARGKCNQIVRCLACNVSPGYRQTKKEAIEAWNTRAEQKPVAVANISFTKEQLERLKEEVIHELTAYRTGERTCRWWALANEDGMSGTCSYCGYTEEWDGGYIPPNYCPKCGAKVVD